MDGQTAWEVNFHRKASKKSLFEDFFSSLSQYSLSGINNCFQVHHCMPPELCWLDKVALWGLPRQEWEAHNAVTMCLMHNSRTVMAGWVQVLKLYHFLIFCLFMLIFIFLMECYVFKEWVRSATSQHCKAGPAFILIRWDLNQSLGSF